MTATTLIMLGLGLAGTFWCIGLVVWVVYRDRAQRDAAIKLMNDALEAILTRAAEIRRQTADEKPARPFSGL